MKKIAIINFYFASKKPEYLDFYMSSCSFNSTVDFLLFTNLDVAYNYDNVKIIHMEFKQFVNIVESKVQAELEKHGINEKVEIKTAYKIADYRPTFGLCFSRYLDGYDFWGHSDLDLIFGDIRKYVSNELLENFDKLYEHGHFSLISNTPECNTLFVDDYINSFYGVIHLDKNSFFEEVYEKKWLPHGGINSIFNKKKRLYKDRKAFCDISFKYNNLIDLKNRAESNQVVFVFDNGKVYRCIRNDNGMKKEEVFYAHFQKRKMYKRTNNLKLFTTTNTGFVDYTDDLAQLFSETTKRNKITYTWIKFRYFEAIKRKLEGNFKLK